MIADLQHAMERILSKRREVPLERSMLVGVTGIDGSGKGYLLEKMVAWLADYPLETAGINLDGWLHLPNRRFDSARPAEHFYEHAIRYQDLFNLLILPLKEKRSLRLEADLSDPTDAAEYHKKLYHFVNVDIVILEGVFLLKKAYRGYFDFTIWVDCTFETALERGLQRGQEGLPPAEAIEAYGTIYFPAQRIHFASDAPREAADLIVRNDPRLGAQVQ